MRPLPAFVFAAAAALVFAAAPSWAQPAPPSRAPPPPALEPLPEIPMPPEIAADPDLEPQVTITRKGGELREEARVSGRIVWIRVTPAHGRPYYLVPDGGANTYIRRDSLDSGLKVPMWVIFTF